MHGITIMFSLVALSYNILMNQTQYSKMIYVNQIKTWYPECALNTLSFNNTTYPLVNLLISRFSTNMLPDNYNLTEVFGFGCEAVNSQTGSSIGFISNLPGPTIKATSGTPLALSIQNTITGNHIYNIDWTMVLDPYTSINSTNIQSVPVTFNIHGNIALSNQGYPASFTTSSGSQGPYYYSQMNCSNDSFYYIFPNLLSQATLIYQDNTIGLKRLNNYAGLNGIYKIESSNSTPLNIVDKYHDLLLNIQDKSFQNDSRLFYNTYWQTSFYGDAIVVNGKVWPFMNVQNTLYRLRIINLCNSRILNLSFLIGSLNPNFTVVKADSSYLDTSYQAQFLQIYPSERYELLFNFTYSIGSKLQMINNALTTAYAYANPINYGTTNKIMKFIIASALTSNVSVNLPIQINNRYILSNPIQTKQIIIIELLDSNGISLQLFFNGHTVQIPYDSLTLGKVYQLNFINLTPYAQSIAINMAVIQVNQRIGFNHTNYLSDFSQLNGAPPYNFNNPSLLDVSNYLTGSIFNPNSQELTNRDIVETHPDEILQILIQFSMPNGSSYPFDATSGPGYSLYTTLLQHQDNSMWLIFNLSNSNIQQTTYNETLLSNFGDSDYVNMLFVNQIYNWLPECIPTLNSNNISQISLNASRTFLSILPPNYPQTEVFAFGCNALNPITNNKLGNVISIPGPTVKATYNETLNIHYTNNIVKNHLFNIDWSFIMDPYHQINTSNIIGIPLTIHVHGQFITSTSDGYPSSFTTVNGSMGPAYYSLEHTNNNSWIYQYPNLINQATLYYHDHSIGMTRINNYAGLNGPFLIETSDPTSLNVLDINHDIILYIQDRTFNTDGSLSYPAYWRQATQYYGDAILVNGKVWPRMSVENGLYRIRLMNICNSRIINLTFVSDSGIIPFSIVKADSGYLDSSYLVNWINLFAGERYQILINFTLSLGSKIILTNNILTTTYPDFNPIDPNTTAYVMRFDIIYSYSGIVTIPIPVLNTGRILLVNPQQVRYTVVIQYLDQFDNPYGSYIDGHDASILYSSEPFIVGSIYQLHLINLTPDAHPFHLHLTRFQIIQRFQFDNTQYKLDFVAANGVPPYYHNKQVYPNTDNYITGLTVLPEVFERGWRDILRVYPGYISVIRIRFALPDGSPYPFDATEGFGYMFHCHIYQHQDNSMMVTFQLQNKVQNLNRNERPLNVMLIILVIFSVYMAFTMLRILISRRKRGLLTESDKISLNTVHTKQSEV